MRTGWHLVGPALAAAMLALTCPGPGAADETLSVMPVSGSAPIPAILLKPPGDGPFAAIVMLHDCSGLGPKSSGAPRRWAGELVAQGYVVIIPDSFGPRGHPDGICTVPVTRQQGVGFADRVADAYGALALLRGLPYVDGRRVAVMGGSHGGATTLVAMLPPGPAGTPLDAARAEGFVAGIALYPRCGMRLGGWTVSRHNGNLGPVTGYSGVYRSIGALLILAGEADDWTPAEHCRRMTETSAAAGYPVEIRIYPGAHHSFDSETPVRYVAARNSPEPYDGKGATTGGNAEAWSAAREDVRAFLARTLAPQ